MPPHIYNKGDEGYYKPFEYLHPGIRKPILPEESHQPHVFQQSVTLTARMWNENDSKNNMDWSFENWGALGKYSPLFIGLAGGFGIVLLIMSTVMLWRYCLISASNKLCCKGVYGDVATRYQKSLPTRKKASYQDEFENKFERPHIQSLPQKKSVSLHNINKSSELEQHPVRQDMSVNNILSHFHQQSGYDKFTDHYTSHSYLQKFETPFIEQSNLSRSTPELEELYAKVNFSKKRKNRMRKDEAAIIAMSKSHSGQNNNSLELFGSAVVVYNERTAL